jgi:hypothetical protein
MTANDEETPLLMDPEATHQAVYARFTPSEKRAITTLVGFSALIPCTPLLQALTYASSNVNRF